MAEAEAGLEKDSHWKHLAWLRRVAVVVAAIPLLPEAVVVAAIPVLPEADAAGHPVAFAWHPFWHQQWIHGTWKYHGRTWFGDLAKLEGKLVCR